MQSFVPEWTEAGPPGWPGSVPQRREQVPTDSDTGAPLPGPGGPCRCSISVWVLGWPWGLERSFREKYRAQMVGKLCLER